MICLVVEDEAFEGVKRVAKKLSDDFEKVFSERPEIVNSSDEKNDFNIVIGTVGNSRLLKAFEIDSEIKIKNKRECYQLLWRGNSLYVIGSDKRGTIYGMFDISEQIGVSPFIYWGDDRPQKKPFFEKEMIKEVESHEPSVEYRGFFINDEWPCFGNWTTSHFGGFTAEMYDKVFELLLRLKGNCLWPAMWSSSFALDGPGQLNEELADIYGVVISYSHHEPCLRASEEWDKVKGDLYGKEWNYSTNKEGLLKYWEDGLKRSGKYENIIVMGMRGERDSVMEGADSLEKSIALWKDIITNQDMLIEKSCTGKHPKLVAIYKEVEDYFFGNDRVEGLKEWSGLSDKVLMFCEDNYGYMRRLPFKEMKKHPGGLGMYYHLDYHGAPVSYEWINTTPLYQIWEQMSEAFEAGIRKMWMVNVGDLKGNEIPLSYFMRLAYDYEKWGSTNTESYNEYQDYWSRQVFEDERVGRLYEDAVKLLYLRRPEALTCDTFNLKYGEADSVLGAAESIEKRCLMLKSEINEEKLKAFYSMVEYPLTIGLNHLKLFIYAEKNRHFALQGKKAANYYGNLIGACYQREKEIKEDFRNFCQGKWKGMEMAAHTGFTKWNEDGAIKPVRYTIEPLEKAQMIVSLPGHLKTAGKNYGAMEEIIIDEYLYCGKNEAAVEIANIGLGALCCQVICDSDDFKFSWYESKVLDQELLLIKPLALGEKNKETVAILTDGDTKVLLRLRQPKNYHLISATAFNERKSFGITKLMDFGKHSQGVKISDNNSRLFYELDINSENNMVLDFITAPTNPTGETASISFELRVNEQNLGRIDTIEPSFKAGDAACKKWAEGALNHDRRTIVKLPNIKGRVSIEIAYATKGMIFEKIILKDESIEETYLENTIG